jgi:glutathione S-transferase
MNPVFAWLLRTLLRLNPKKVQDSLDQIRSIDAGVDSRLADGGKFLVGAGLTLSDLAFAVAAAPAVLPSEYGGPMLFVSNALRGSGRGPRNARSCRGSVCPPHL